LSKERFPNELSLPPSFLNDFLSSLPRLSLAFFLYDFPWSDFLPSEDGFFLILKNYVVGKGTEFHMQKALNNIIVCCIPYLLTAVLSCAPSFTSAQEKDNASHNTIKYLTRDQSKLIHPPQKFPISPQVDFITGTSRVQKGDRSGIGYSATIKGVRQLGNYWHLNLGFGLTRLNSRQIATADSLSDSLHFANILHAPFGLSFIIGDDRAQIITTLDLMPCYNAGHSTDVTDQKVLNWGASTEFGFLLRLRRHWYTGLTGKLQVFKSFDRQDDAIWPQYGFAGVGLVVRFSY
jgi:hypothetical protein